MSSSETYEGTRRRRPRLAVASVAAAVLLAGGGGVYLATNASGGSGSNGSGAPAEGGAPPPLVLDGLDSRTGGDGRDGRTGGDDRDGRTEGIAPGEPDPGGARYRAEGELPDGPGSAPVYRPSGRVSSTDVTRLAEALDVPGSPRAEGASWKVGAPQDGPALQVGREAPGTWSFTRFGPGGTDDCPKGKACTTIGSAPAPGAGSGAGTPVSEAAAKQAAAPVLKALGQDDAKVDASRTLGAVRVVNADPVIGGLPTHGWATGIQVGADGQLVNGSGHLAEPVKGATYPVIGAEKSLEQLNKSASGEGGVTIGGSDAAPQGAEPVAVTDARFGLALHFEKGRPALVPSWLFTVAPEEGPSHTVTQPAVHPKYLTEPSAPAPKPSPTTAPGERDVRIESYRADGRTLTVTFWGGVCHDYAATAKESGDRVEVKVTETKQKQDQVCIMIAKQLTETVTLDKELGDRTVVGTNGAAVQRK